MSATTQEQSPFAKPVPEPASSEEGPLFHDTSLSPNARRIQIGFGATTIFAVAISFVLCIVRGTQVGQLQINILRSFYFMK